MDHKTIQRIRNSKSDAEARRILRDIIKTEGSINKLYQARFTDCIYESAHYTLSVHRTEAGARKALSNFIRTERKEHEKYIEHYKGLGADNIDIILWQTHKAWDINEIKVEE